MASIREIRVKNILVKSNLPGSDFSANPYVGCGHACKYCYASFMKRFANHPEPWGEFVDAKSWDAPKNPEKYRGKEIFLSSVTDPYQPAEAKFGRTRQLLEQLQGSGCRLSIVTKSDLVLRDLDLLKSFPGTRVAWSINTLDPVFQRQMDRGAPVERRIAAMRAFHEAGVETVCFISPIFPCITRPEEIIRQTRDHCDSIWLESLNLRGPYRHEILGFIAGNHPGLLPLYKEIYIRENRSWWRALDTRLKDFCARAELPYLRNADPDLGRVSSRPVVVNYFFHKETTR